MRKRILFLLCFLFVSAAAVAQEDDAKNKNGSFYSLYGVGYPYDNTTARESGMGILGVSLSSIESNTLQNPAAWGSNFFSTASSGFRFSQYETQNKNSKSVNSLLETGYLQFIFPIYKEKLGFSASLYPVTKSSYRVFSPSSYINSPADTINYITDYSGSGGINKLELGFGWKINKNLSVGYAPSFAFLTRNNSESVYFSQSGLADNFLDKRYSGTAMGHRFGALFEVGRLLNQNDFLSIGAALTLPINFNAEQNKTINKQISGVLQEVVISTEKGTLTLPMEMAFGFTYYPNNYLNVSAEGQFQQWSKFRSDIQPTDENFMADRTRAGIGAEYHPYRFGSDRLLSKFRYSAGIAYDTGHLQIAGKKIDTIWLSAGIGLRTLSRSSVDISFQYGLRGTTANSLIKENIWALNLSVNLAELMFIRPKLD